MDNPSVSRPTVSRTMKFFFRIWRLLILIPGMQLFLLRRMNAKFIIGASALIVDETGRVLLFHHTYRRKFEWDFPGGWIKRGENAAHTLVREAAEESALAVEIIAPISADTVPGQGIIDMVYLARLTGGEFLPSSEVDECRWWDEPPADFKREHLLALEAVRRLMKENRLPARTDA